MTTAVSTAVLGATFPPSNAVFSNLDRGGQPSARLCSEWMSRVQCLAADAAILLTGPAAMRGSVDKWSSKQLF